MSALRLSRIEASHLKEFISKGSKSARSITRARILLLVNERKSERATARTLGICKTTVLNIKKRFREEGLERALSDRPRPGQPRKYTNKHEAEIIATACTSPPEGRKRWTLVLLMDELRKKPGLKTINRETIRLVLKKAKRSPG